MQYWAAMDEPCYYGKAAEVMFVIMPGMCPIADIIDTTAIQGYKSDLKWRFVKRSGSVGIYSAPAEPLQPDDILVI